MKTFLVIGYGNTLRGDDGLGPAIVGNLDIKRISVSNRVRTVCLPQLDISLVSELQHADVAIFVDARQDGDEALIHVDRLKPSHPSSIAAHSTHAMDITALLGITDQWYAKNPVCYLIKPKGFNFGIGDTLSEQGRQAGGLAEEMIYKIIRRWSNKGID